MARLHDFGNGDYAAILELQQELHAARLRNDIPDTWLIGEHPLVVTQGVRSDPSDLLQVNPSLRSAPIFQIDRGGMTTLHSPGQMILYPIVKLPSSLDAGRFSRELLQAMRDWIETHFEVSAEIVKGQPGLYVQGRKLLSIGISGRLGVTMHGIALNVSNDLTLWQGLIACGDPSSVPTSLAFLLDRAIDWRSSVSSLAEHIKSVWKYETVHLGPAPQPKI